MRQEFLDKIAKIEEVHGPLEEPKRPYNSSIYDIEPEDEDDVMTIKRSTFISGYCFREV